MTKHSHTHHPPPPQHHRPPPQYHRPPPQNHHQPPPQHHNQKVTKHSQAHHPPPPPPQPQYHPQPPHHHHLPPQPPLPPPYRPPKPPKHRRTTLASCIVATIFLLFITILICIIYFSLLKPKDPKINVTAITLPTFTTSTNSTATVSFTFSLYAAVRNPNHATFSHFDSSLQLLYAGNQVGFMFIPAGKISPGETEFMTATFSVQSFPLSAAPVAAVVVPPVFDGVDRVQPTMEMEVRLEMVGRVRVLWFFAHNVQSVSDCDVAVSINGGSVLGFHC